MYYLKPSLTVAQLCDVLKNKGLIVEDDQIAIDSIKKFSYYRLHYYLKNFENNNSHFPHDCCFSDILLYHEFDHWLRNFILLLLGPIEISLSSQLSQHLGEKYGSHCFYIEENFEDKYKYSKVMESLTKYVQRNPKEPRVEHHNKYYRGYFPIFVIVQILSFSNLSMLFSSLKLDDGNAISELFSDHLEYKIKMYYAKSWFYSLSSLRNLCAHHEPLYDRKFRIVPRMDIFDNWPSSKNNSLFALLLIIKRLSDPNYWNSCMDIFQNYLYEDNYVDLSKYGFPLRNWKFYLLKGA